MENLKPLSDFFSAIKNDFRISSTHIAIYVSLLHYRRDKGFINPIEAFGRDITALAKLSSVNTYHKCIQELAEYGYIIYVPSFKKNQGSKIFFFEY